VRVEFQIFRRQAHGAERRKNARHAAWQGDTLIWESQAHCVAYAEFGTEAGWGTNFLHGFNEPLHKLHGRTGSVFKMEAWTNARVYGAAHGVHIAPCGRTLGPSPLASGASSLGGCGIRAACDHLPRVLDHPRGWMPALPPLPRTPTVWTPPGLAPRALLVAWSGGSPGEDCASPLDRPLHLGPRRLHAPLHRGQRRGGRHPVIPATLAACGERVRPQAAKKWGALHACVLHAVAAVGPLRGLDSVAILAREAPDREGG
jgi:hypothetical protein